MSLCLVLLPSFLEARRPRSECVDYALVISYDRSNNEAISDRQIKLLRHGLSPGRMCSS